MKKKYFLPILFFTCIALLFSCTAEKHLAKAVKKDKPYVAEQTRLMFPCIETKNGKPDSTAYKKYLQELKELQDFYESQETPQARIDSFETVWTDSTKVVELQKDLVKQKGLYKELANKCQDNPPIHDTTYLEDSALVLILTNNIKVAAAMHKADTLKLRGQIATITKEVKDVKQGRNRWRKWCLWTWGAMGLVVLFKIFRSKIGL